MKPLPRARATFWPRDALLVLLLAACWVAAVGTVTHWRRVVLLDTFRDLACATNMRAGNLGADPTLPGYPYWYAPGNPLLIAGLSRLTGCSVLDLYGYSPLWLNVWLPVGLFLLVRAVWDRTTALLALPLTLLGSYWWLTHVTANIPGLQGVALNLLGLWLWHRCSGATSPGRAAVWATATGLTLALSTWQHPVCGLMLAGTIGLHTLLAARALPPALRGGRPGARMLVVATVAGLLTAPLTVHMARLQSGNSSLVRFFASELIEPPFYAHALTPLVVALALGGVWTIARTRPQSLWIVAYAAIGLLGQLLGYIGHSPNWHIPYVLPHEFQWHGQLALGICAAVGAVALGHAARRHWPTRPWCAPAALLLVTVVAVAPAVPRLPQATQYFFDLEPLLTRTQPLRSWINTHTTLDDVFIAPPDTAYMVIAGLTGRKAVVVWPGHMNPLADYARRSADTQALLEATNEANFLALARRYHARYLAVLPDSPAAARERQARYRDWTQVRLAFSAYDDSALVFAIEPPPPSEGSP